ncbi:MAG: acyl CoA--acetate/3-ketoacid CoA transferase subunit beta [Deltaproteobacteria bacterium]|nr:acyl CoA--acetate/3-ketoacid CoA transferase subunit beta [Deltaproteobacteria bacterium]
MTPATHFAEREHLICTTARMIEENKSYWVGGGGEPLYTILLAQRLYTPGVQYLTEDGVVSPKALLPWDPLMTMVASRAGYRALQWGTMNTAGNFAQLGYVDIGILNTLQVDKFGNVNSTVLGPYAGGRGRRFGGPGGADTIAAQCWRTILLTDQQKRKFVERVDFISSPGFLEGPGAREAAGLPAGTGPWRVVTPWAMFGYEEKSCELMPMAVSPFVTVDMVLAEMSFTPKMAPQLKTLDPPTEEELTVIRSSLDVEGQTTGRGQWVELRDGKYMLAETQGRE